MVPATQGRKRKIKQENAEDAEKEKGGDEFGDEDFSHATKILNVCCAKSAESLCLRFFSLRSLHPPVQKFFLLL